MHPPQRIRRAIDALIRRLDSGCPCGGDHTVRHLADLVPDHVPAEWVTAHGSNRA